MLAMAAFTFTSCEDVPMPYDKPGTGGDDTPSTDYYLNETFASSFGVFSLTTVEGTPWTINYSTATATGYDNSSKTTTQSKSYLVSPEIDLSKSEKAYLEFEYIYRYGGRTGAEDKVLITSNYTGDPTTTSWTDITGTLTEGSDWTTFSKYSKNIPSEFLGQAKVVVALYYACTSSSATWEVKNLVMADGTASESGSDSGDDKGGDSTGGDTTGEAKGSGTASDPYNVAAMLQLANSYDESKTYYVEGIVTKVSKYNESFGSLSYYISDDGKDANTFYIYSGLGLNKAKFTSTSDLAVGSKVVVCGKCTVYSGTFEFQYDNYIVSLNGQGGTDSGDDKGGDTGDANGKVSIDGTTVTLTNPDVTAGTESVTLTVNDLGLEDKSSAAGTYSFSDGTTITLAQGEGRNTPVYYASSNGFRLYAENTITFSASKKIAKIVMSCDTYNNTDYVGNEVATVNFDGTTAVYRNYNSGSTSGGTQLRVKQITIFYAN
jgi:hypothetical protein